MLSYSQNVESVTESVPVERYIGWAYTYSKGAQRPSGLERRTGDRVVLGWNPAGGTSLRNFGNSVYTALPVTVSFGGDTKSRWSLLYLTWGSKRGHSSVT